MNKQAGDEIRCISTKPFEGKKVAPPLKLGEKYIIMRVINDSKGYPHFDVGLKSEYSYITSQETGEELPDGDKVHWCHPSRFESVN